MLLVILCDIMKICVATCEIFKLKINNSDQLLEKKTAHVIYERIFRKKNQNEEIW